MKVIGNVATQDDYADPLTIEDNEANLLSFLVANASAIAMFRASRRESGGDQSYGPELLLTPQSQPIPNVSGAKFRSALPGTPARIIASLVGPDDAQIGAGNPFTGTLSAAGVFTPAEAKVSELVYVEFNTLVAIAGTEVAPTTIVSATVGGDGVTVMEIEFYAPEVDTGAGVGDAIGLNLWDVNDLGRLVECRTVGASAMFAPAYAKRRLTPTPGSHTYSVRGWQAGGAGNVQAGPGGAGNYLPGFIRISRVNI